MNEIYLKKKKDDFNDQNITTFQIEPRVYISIRIL